MTLEEAKALHRKVSGIRAVFRIGLDHLEQEKPVLAFKEHAFVGKDFNRLIFVNFFIFIFIYYFYPAENSVAYIFPASGINFRFKLFVF